MSDRVVSRARFRLRAAAADDRLAGGLAILIGTLLAFGVQALAPVGVPLYDGVVVAEPYRYLHPTGQQPGNPTSFSSAPTVQGVVSPLLAAATTEAPPQAQLIAQRDAFQLTPGATNLQVSIAPIEPPSVPPDQPIAGNVYRISVTDQAGAALQIKPCQGCVTLLLRGPETLEAGRLLRFADGAWTDVNAIHNSMTGMYQWNATGLGDFAIVSATGGEAGLGLDRILVFGGGAVILGLLFAAAWAFRRRTPRGPAPGRRLPGATPPAPTPRAGPRSRGVPSKRTGPRRPPPSGRSDR